jgi:sigma-B regulation protein RsbU (phosphoserine phosphatase)
MSAEPATAQGFFSSRVHAVLSRRGRAFWYAAVAGAFGAVAAADFATAADLSFLVFYLLPVLLASWYLGPREGFAVSVASVAAWTVDDLLTHRIYAGPAVPVWNHGGELVFFVFLGWLAGALKEALAREARFRVERLESELSTARDVQARLLPEPRVAAGDLSAAAECRQARGVGGDLYDLERLPNGSLFVAVADVSGKGMPAALLMTSVVVSLRHLLPVHADRLDLLAAELSERLRALHGAPRFVTAFLAVLEDGRIRWVNAGHLPGLVAAGERVASLGSTGTVLGLVPGARFREETVPFPPGARLVLYTDGLTECENAAGEEFGGERVARAVAGAAGPPSSTIEALLAAAASHAAGEPFGDDVTVLCVERSPAVG